MLFTYESVHIVPYATFLSVIRRRCTEDWRMFRRSPLVGVAVYAVPTRSETEFPIRITNI